MSRTSARRKRPLNASTPAGAHRGDEVVRELLGRRARGPSRPSPNAAHVVADRVQEVRLADARRAVDEERVVGLAGQLGDRERGGVGEAVAVADDELVEGELRAERVLARAASRRPDSGVRSWAGAVAVAVGDELDLGSVAEHVRRGVAEVTAEAAVDPRADRRLGREHERARRRARRGRSGVEPELGGLRVDDASQLAADLLPDVGELRGVGRRDRPLRRGAATAGEEGPGGPGATALGTPSEDRSIGSEVAWTDRRVVPARSEDPRAAGSDPASGLPCAPP